MTNRDALRSMCNAIASSFYPDCAAVDMVLFNEGIDADADSAPKDVSILRLAVSLVMGYVEQSRSENGVSVSVMQDAVKESIRYWCNIYGLDADEVLADYIRVIEDGSQRW